MDLQEIRHIENKIGYTFKNKALLEQAFTRRSYANEKKLDYDNEVLEFIGDELLDMIVARFLIEHYSKTSNDHRVFTLNEGNLTDLKIKIVSEEPIAKVTDQLHLAEHLIMGKGDIAKHVENNPSVKCDLYEAVIGAIGLDTDFNLNKISEAIISNLNIPLIINGGSGKDTVTELQELCQKKGYKLPLYTYEKDRDNDWITTCYIEEVKHSETTKEFTKAEGRMETAFRLLMYLIQNKGEEKKLSFLDNVNLKNAKLKLHELGQKKLIKGLTYSYKQTSSNRIWECICSVQDYVSTKGRAMKKSEADAQAAYEMIVSIKNKLSN